MPVPAAPNYLAADFASALLALLPHGPVWPRDADATLPLIPAGLAPTYERLTARCAALLQDAPAGTLNEMLPEWEATRGLPDPCAGTNPSLQQRRMSVAAQIAARGGQSAAYFIGIVAALGRMATVETFAPARCGALACGQPLYGPDWDYVWLMTVSGPTLAGGYTSNAVIECVLRRFMPAHTVLILKFLDFDAFGPEFSDQFLDGTPMTGEFSTVQFDSSFSQGTV